MTNNEFDIKLVTLINEAILAGVTPTFVVGALQVQMWQQGFNINIYCQKRAEMAEKIGELVPKDEEKAS